MGREATKAAGNRWYEARKEAAKGNERLSSRAGAAEMLNVSEDVIKDVELNLYKTMPVETAVRMADAYNAPELLNYYCTHECPIGREHHPLSSDVLPLEKVTIKLLKRMRLEDVSAMRERLLEVALSGDVEEYERDEVEEIIRFFNDLYRDVSELKIICEKALKKMERND